MFKTIGNFIKRKDFDYLALGVGYSHTFLGFVFGAGLHFLFGAILIVIFSITLKQGYLAGIYTRGA